MDSVKTLKKGEILFKEGEPIQSVYIIKSGRISLFMERNGKKSELIQISNGRVLGEEGLSGQPKRATSAMATVDTNLLEIPFNVFKARYEALDALNKIFIKGMVDKSTDMRSLLRTIQMEQDNSPCPQKLIPRVFGSIALIAQHTMRKTDGSDIVVAWNALKLYATRTFLEAPNRLQSAIELLQKLKYATMQFQKNEDGIDELTNVVIHDVRGIEEFADFYQYHFYKPGRSEIIFVDQSAMQVAKALVEVSEGAPVDHKQATNLEFETLKKALMVKFRLDQRKSRDEGVFLVFDRVEFAKTLRFWQIINEIDKWNDKGFVDLKEKEVVVSQGDGGGCPECGHKNGNDNKFCGNCGAKLANAA
jgi:Cyclic nucleotide-binding domain